MKIYFLNKDTRMKKITLLYIVALIQCHISLSMLTKQLYRLPKHSKNIHSKNIDLIRNILKNNPYDKNDNDYEDDFDIYSYYNENIIDILTDDIKNTRTVIKTLKKQQRFAALDLVNNNDLIQKIEQKLHTSFNLKKDNE